MGESAKTSSAYADRHWFILGRWQEYEGEARANVLRIIAIGTFYIVELCNYYGLDVGFIELPKLVDTSFHQTITALAVAWTLLNLGVLFLLNRRIFPWFLKFFSTGCDIVLLTVILMVADGPRSPLVVGYFLLIAISTLRFNLPLIWTATVGSMLAYLFLLGHAEWFRNDDPGIPRYHQIIFLLSLGLTGIVLGQVIRRVRRLAKDYAARIESSKGGSDDTN